jgi:hypothetical protein
MGNFKGAFELYTQALESFMVVYKQERNAALKVSVTFGGERVGCDVDDCVPKTGST